MSWIATNKQSSFSSRLNASDILRETLFFFHQFFFHLTLPVANNVLLKVTFFGSRDTFLIFNYKVLFYSNSNFPVSRRRQ